MATNFDSGAPFRHAFRWFSRGAFLALALSGCTNAILRPTFPDNSPPQAVQPLHTYTDGADGQHVVVKVFLVHGMSHSDSTWADNFIHRLADRLKISVPPCTAGNKIELAASPWRDNKAVLCVVSGSTGTTDYWFYALQWSPLTDPYKCTEPFLSDRDANDPISSDDKKKGGVLCDETNPGFPVRRAAVNGVIKDHVLDDGFPDVLVYLARDFQPVFWDVVSEALCRLYSSDPRTTTCGAPSERLPDRCAPIVPMPTKDQRYVFITHSLGANVLLDTFSDNVRCAEAGPSASRATLGSAIAATFEGRTPLYLLANQHALLQLSKASRKDFPPNHALTTSAAAAPSIFDIRNHPFFTSLAARPRPQSKEDGDGQATHQVDIVAFSDPNDDLTFLLPTKTLPISGVTVQNVLVRDDWEYGLVIENPDSAHVNYFKKPDEGNILGVIFCGMDRNGVPPC